MKLPTIALAQINPVVGDVAGNAKLILAEYRKAKKKGADLVVCPELSLVGYPPEDLVLMPALVREAMDAAKKLARETAKGPALIVGSPWEEGEGKNYALSREIAGSWTEKKKTYNAALLLDGGKIKHVAHKIMLPNYSIFDEKRIFTPGTAPNIIKWRGIKLGLLVCEDVWSQRLPKALKKQGADLLVIINASPFEAGKLKQRKQIAAAAVKATGAPLVYVNCVGGQDDIVFDGGSFVMSAKGEVEVQLPEFKTALQVYPAKSKVAATMPVEQTVWEAMKLGLADYVHKNNFPGVMLGLSGGIDSAITAACAVDALGRDKVKGVLLPSPYTSKDSIEDAEETAGLLGIETMTVPIALGMESFHETLSPLFGESNWMTNISLGGNLQARLRGITMMAISNRFGWMLLSTGNKSEIAVGYSTLYGDSCGGYNVVKDLYKTQVYVLANWRNKQSRVIPERSITKAPTAELAPGQKDQDQLPPYDVLDRILYHHIEERRSAKEIIALGFAAAIVNRVVKLVRISEYKRRQSCPGVRLSPMLFGKDRRYPLTNGSNL